jgi:hypothetical protein
MKNFFQIGVKRCYSVTKLKNIDISTLLEQKSVTLGVLQGVTSVTNSQDLSKQFSRFKNHLNIKTGTNEEAHCL